MLRSSSRGRGSRTKQLIYSRFGWLHRGRQAFRGAPGYRIGCGQGVAERSATSYAGRVRVRRALGGVIPGAGAMVRSAPDYRTGRGYDVPERPARSYRTLVRCPGARRTIVPGGITRSRSAPGHRTAVRQVMPGPCGGTITASVFWWCVLEWDRRVWQARVRAGHDAALVLLHNHIKYPRDWHKRARLEPFRGRAKDFSYA
jgi:hypothetical protein